MYTDYTRDLFMGWMFKKGHRTVKMEVDIYGRWTTFSVYDDGKRFSVTLVREVYCPGKYYERLVEKGFEAV